VSELRFDDRTDFEDAERGKIGALEPCAVTDASGRVVWNNDAFALLYGECLLGMLAGQGLGGTQTWGDPAVLQRLLALLDEPDPGFAIVTP
jgi:alkyl sulfatase BDS1-like metallo-beta-lactamase superfamily hydrolase